MIRQRNKNDFDSIYEIINDSAQLYKGVIPADCWKEPYMSRDELRYKIKDGVIFWGYEEDNQLSGVMGIQHVQDVTLIRHAYVRTIKRGQGIDTALFEYLRALTDSPIVIGTWANTIWAIRFYEKHGFQLVS